MTFKVLSPVAYLCHPDSTFVGYTAFQIVSPAGSPSVPARVPVGDVEIQTVAVHTQTEEYSFHLCIDGSLDQPHACGSTYQEPGSCTHPSCGGNGSSTSLPNNGLLASGLLGLPSQ